MILNLFFSEEKEKQQQEEKETIINDDECDQHHSKRRKQSLSSSNYQAYLPLKLISQPLSVKVHGEMIFHLNALKRIEKVEFRQLSRIVTDYHSNHMKNSCG
jgi:hypothetical protein